ncbi:hypothetical protein RHO14_02345 [Orbus wheelerorum]|uniref:hypothetical protein n=1 Tax=Orbus wheelerorum TaxID=3074111 RepID=UPI00370D931C
MGNDNFKLIGDIESALLQAQSMANIALDNHNYKSMGYDEPFITHNNMGNLLWAITDLINKAYDDLQKIEIKGDANNG